jgi:hypothetical protein
MARDHPKSDQLAKPVRFWSDFPVPICNPPATRPCVFIRAICGYNAPLSAFQNTV